MISDQGQSLRRALGGGPPTPERRDGWWPTPLEPTVALFRHLRQHEAWALDLGRREGVLEPACGDGAMARPMEVMGFPVRATDLVWRGHGTGGIDFLTMERVCERMIVTNPPYTKGMPEKFIRKAATFRRAALTALLLKSSFWHAGGRLPLFREWRPAWLLPLTWRPDFTGGGNSPFQLQWVVWSRDSTTTGRARLEPLPKPEFTDGGGLW